MKKIFFCLLMLINSCSYSQQGWVYSTMPQQDDLEDVVFKSSNTGFVKAWSQSIYKTTNAGASWTKTTLGNNETRFGAIAYAGGNTWYLSDYMNPVTYKTTNDGVSWDSIATQFQLVTDLQFLNENTGFGIFKYTLFFKTTNGGTNWFINNNIGGQNWSVNFIDENTGYVGGGNNLRKTTNGGITFDTIPKSYVYYAWDVKFINRDTIFAAGHSRKGNYVRTVWKTTNAGINWLPYHTGAGYLSGQIEFPTAQTGYVSDGWGAILKTTNAGENWFEINSPASTTGIFFTSAETGYVVGLSGMIAKTTNGGIVSIANSELTLNKYNLFQNYPNPFNPSTKIKFELSQLADNSSVKIIVYDILG
ncbi:MAG: hypothetical protein J0M18_21230, partial [Ignavibacteria bacterium]|nr:hypothetical protein [Ignavibacteria bacterium]